MRTFTFPIGFAVSFLLCAAGGCSSTPPATATTPAPLPRLSKSDPVYAYVASMRDDLSRGKVDSINAVMRLNAEEAKAFWPIYQEYESELFDLGDQRMELIRQFVMAQQSERLDNARATEITDGYFRYEADRLALLKKYHGEIAKALSPLRAAQFAQIEHRVSTVVDLLIASELPFVRVAR